MTSLVVIDEGSAQAKATFRNEHGQIITTVVAARIAEQVLKVRRLKNMDVSELLSQASRNVMMTILRELEAMVPVPELLDKVLIVGGGAALMGKELAEEMGVDVLIPENPDMAISRGIFKLETLKAVKRH